MIFHPDLRAVLSHGKLKSVWIFLFQNVSSSHSVCRNLHVARKCDRSDRESKGKIWSNRTSRGSCTSIDMITLCSCRVDATGTGAPHTTLAPRWSTQLTNWTPWCRFESAQKRHPIRVLRSGCLYTCRASVLKVLGVVGN